MDRKEIAHIRQNLQSLSKVTICNTDLLNSLIKRGLLTNEESSKLLEVRSQKDRWKAATQLYTILIETSDRLNWLLNLPVKLSGEFVPLHTKFPKFDYEDAYQVLKAAAMDKDELSLVTNIKMNPELPPPRALYVPRSISNRRKLDPQIFRENCQDVFVFQGMSKSLLDEMVAPNFSRSSSEQLFLITSRYIYLEKDEDWDFLLGVIKDPMHWVIKEYHDYILYRSTLLTDVVLRFSSQSRGNKYFYVSEEQFLKDVVTAKDGKGALICDLPGMGKSWFMESIAWKLRNLPESTDTVVFFIQLPELSKYLIGCKIVDSSETSLKTILGFVNPCNLSVHLLCYLVTRRSLRLIFVLDGFDEIPQKEVDSTTMMLKHLDKENKVTVIVSSRPHLREILERKFNLISFDIHPFATHEQLNYITSVWRYKFPVCKEDKLQNLAKQCIAGMSSVKKDNLYDILGVPLKCYILATVNEKMVEQVTKIGSDIEVPEIVILKTTSDFYDAFVKIRMAKISSRDELHQVLNFHVFTALELLFPDIAKQFSTETDLQQSNIDVLRPGILINNTQQQITFIHRSFAEYFAGKFFSEFWMNLGGVKYTANFTRQVGDYFIDRVLATDVERSTMIWSPIDFNQVGFKGIPSMDNIQFEAGTTLWFMDNIFSTYGSSQPFMDALVVYKKQCLQHCIMEKEVKLLSRFSKCTTSGEQEPLRSTTLLLAVIGCVEAGLPFLCGLIGNLLNSLLKGRKICELLRLPDTKQKHIMTLLVSKIALGNSIETGTQVFNIFDGSYGNDLTAFCQDFPEEFYSPLEIAIAANHEQLFDFLFDKVKIPKERLLLRCFLGPKMTETEITTRLKILEKIMKSDESVALPVTSSETKIYLASLTNNEQTNFELFRCFGVKNGVSLFYLPRCCKAALLRLAICNDSDGPFFDLIIALFCKRRQQWLNHSATTTKDNNSTFAIKEEEQELKAIFVLQTLDLADAYETFISLELYNNEWVDIGSLFQNIRKLEALKLLIEICPDFTKCTFHQLTYLHLAVKNGNMDWVNHLLGQSQDVNQEGRYYRTPLHYISCPSCLEITELLVAKGADMFAVDVSNENVAHHFFSNTCINEKDIMQWVNYTLNNGYAELYNGRNSTGNEPLEILIDRVGMNHQLVTYISSAIQSHLAPNHKRSIWRHLIFKGNDQQLLKQIQMDFCQQETPNDGEIIPVEKILGRIDVDFAKDALLEFAPYYDYCALSNIRNLESLKVLLGICNDFSLLNEKRVNYLHIAVFRGRVDWVEHLVIAGHDIHQRDQDGHSPLLYITSSSPVHLSRLLLQNKADIYLTNNYNQNVAHRLLIFKPKEELYAWVAYTLEMGYEKLWYMKDCAGKTPFEILIKKTSNLDGPQTSILNMKSLLYIFNEDFRANISQFRTAGFWDRYSFIKLVFEQKLSLQNMKTDKKAWLLSGIMETTSYDWMAKLLLLLFPNYSVRFSDISMLCSNDYPKFSTQSDVEEIQILQLLNVEDVELHLKKLRVDPNHVFSDIKCVDLLELKF